MLSWIVPALVENIIIFPTAAIFTVESCALAIWGSESSLNLH